jgi:hypothetical protein
LPKFETLLEKAEGEINAIGRKRARLLEENVAEMKSALNRRDALIELKEYFMAWGAQDKKVIEEWAPSR